MRLTRIFSINNATSGIDANANPASLPAQATAYKVERDKSGRISHVYPPAVTVLEEAVAGPPGGCPQCGMMPGGKPLRESEDERHKLYRCSNCGTDFAVTDGLEG